MISLFDANFLSILFEQRARVPRDRKTGQPVHRAQERIDFLVTTLSKQKTKIILPAPAIAEFMLLASDKWNEYLTIIHRKAVFEIVGFDEPQAVALVEYCEKHSKVKTKRSGPETWAKVKYDLQIAAIAKTSRVEVIYSTDRDLHKIAEKLEIQAIDLSDLPDPPPVQLTLDESVKVSAETGTPSADRPADPE